MKMLEVTQIRIEHFTNQYLLDIGTRLPYIKYYQQYIDCNFLLVAYRGYSYSTGSPSERGLQLDSQVRFSLQCFNA